MSWIAGMRVRLQSWIGRADAEERMSEEFRFHLEMEAERLIRSGVAAEEAWRRARIAFGGVELHKESMRDGRRVPILEELWRDVRQSLRSLRRRPVLAVVAIATLALGVGANAAVFGLVNATLFRPLPFPQADRLVVLYQHAQGAGPDDRPVAWSYPEFEALRSRLSSLPTLAAYYSDDGNLSGGKGEPVRLSMEMVSASYFDLLGVRPTLGRSFQPTEDSVPGANAVALIGHALWASAFGSDSSIVGQRIRLNGVGLDVIGVLPDGFRGLSGEADIWIPNAMAPSVYYQEHLTTPQHYIEVVGRLRPGTTLEEARAEVQSVGSTVAASVREQIGADDEMGLKATLLPLGEARRDPAALRAQFALAGAVCFVLLIAAVNLSGLLLAQAIGRTRELAVRAALGAGRRRILRQTVVESTIIGLAGGAAGALLATWSIRLLSAVAPEQMGGTGQRFAQLGSFAAPSTDWRVVTFAVVVALVVGMVAGILPVLRVTRRDLTDVLKAGARGSTLGVGSLRRPTVLSVATVVQVAMALVLLAGAGQLLRGVQRLRAVDPGVDADGVLTFRLNPPESVYSGLAASVLQQQVLERVQAVPGVTAATVGRCAPFGGRCSTTPLYQNGRPITGEPPIVGRHYVGADYFSLLRIPLLRGRLLTDADRAGSQRVAVINQTAASRFWPGLDPLGKQLWFGSGGGFASPDSLTTIVGVVADAHYSAPEEPIAPDFYTSYLQFTVPETMVMVRAAGNPLSLLPMLRSAVAEVDSDLPISDVQMLRDRSAGALNEARFATGALATFAGLGLLLASLGVYGVMAYSVAQRRRETGIRIALGATPRSVLQEVVWHGLTLASVGLGIGAVVALALGRGLSALVPGIDTADPLVFAVVIPVLLLVTVLTCYRPALQASRVSAVESLAAE